jgi:hypothetical protein
VITKWKAQAKCQFNQSKAHVWNNRSVVRNRKAFCKIIVLVVDICYLNRVPLPVAQDFLKRLHCSIEVTELQKVGCCYSKMDRAIVDNINYVARFVALSEGGKCSFVVRLPFWELD